MTAIWTQDSILACQKWILWLLGLDLGREDPVAARSGSWVAMAGSWAAATGSESSMAADLQSPVGRRHEAEPF